MTLFFISFLAGVLTVLAPCILPLLPVVIGSSVGSRSRFTPVIVIGSLALSILLFTFLLKASTALITIPPAVWASLSGGILIGFGLITLFPRLWSTLPFVSRASIKANQAVGAGYQEKSVWGDVLIGAALGPVFSTCSPTYFVILATVLPASFFLGTAYLLTYLLGLVLILGLIALLGQRLTQKLQWVAADHSMLKRILGVLFIVVGIFIITGLDKKLETAYLENSWFNVAIFEQAILDTFIKEESVKENATIVPDYLRQQFPDTKWHQADPAIAKAISGGPGKDGIPAIDDPQFISASEYRGSPATQAIVVIGETQTTIYPYNILTWHEIVNDFSDGRPIAVTFCPLCGSAIVFDRTLPDGTVSTFGVSGSLLESNMIMYDRATESLWQQSTGKTLAGRLHPSTLALVPFQLLTVEAALTAHPKARILSQDTGYNRDYDFNPYSGYETDNRFVFEPSLIDTTFPPKEIMVVANLNAQIVVVPWKALRETGTATVTVAEKRYQYSLDDAGALTIQAQDGSSTPFYFEMWFSVHAQHQDAVRIVTPS